MTDNATTRSAPCAEEAKKRYAEKERRLADAAALNAGDGVVGLALDPGQYPALGLAPGDRVNVVRSGETAPETDDAPDTQVIARGATVFAIEDLSSDRKLVSILTSEGDAEVVAATAGAGGLRLVLVATP